MGKKSALGVYRSLEVELAEVRQKRAKDDAESLEEIALVARMDDVWYNELSQSDRDTLSKES